MKVSHHTTYLIVCSVWTHQLRSTREEGIWTDLAPIQSPSNYPNILQQLWIHEHQPSYKKFLLTVQPKMVLQVPILLPSLYFRSHLIYLFSFYYYLCPLGNHLHEGGIPVLLMSYSQSWNSNRYLISIC